MVVGSSDGKETRRGFLKKATLAMGGAIGVVMAVPLVRYILYPVGRKVVSTPDEPIDVGAAADLIAGAPPVRLPIIASGVRDAWSRSGAVAVGSCWVRKDEGGAVTALSSVCPHLGCSISYSEKTSDFRCPCHNSSFALDGEKKDDGPAKRGMDPLAVTVTEGRVKVKYQRFRNDIPEREPV